MSKKVIENLTPDQEKALELYRNMAIKIGMATGSDMNEQLVHELTDKHRVLCGMKPAKHFLVVDSPKAAVALNLGADPANAMYGQHDAHWLMFYMFFRIECGLVAETEKIVHLAELSKHIGWWWADEDHTIVSRRPDELHTTTKKGNSEFLPEIQVLHNEKGPAVKYRDGFEIYAVHGTRLPVEYEWLVKDNIAGTLTIEKVLQAKNAEMVTLGQRILGPTALIKSGKAIDKWKSKKGGSYVLYQVNIGEQKRLYLSGSCPSKGSPFCEPVPPSVGSCKEALHWREEKLVLPFSGSYEEPEIRT